MQQKLKDYKEVIHELETERQAMEAALATEKEKVRRAAHAIAVGIDFEQSLIRRFCASRAMRK